MDTLALVNPNFWTATTAVVAVRRSPSSSQSLLPKVRSLQTRGCSSFVSIRIADPIFGCFSKNIKTTIPHKMTLRGLPSTISPLPPPTTSMNDLVTFRLGKHNGLQTLMEVTSAEEASSEASSDASEHRSRFSETMADETPGDAPSSDDDTDSAPERHLKRSLERIPRGGAWPQPHDESVDDPPRPSSGRWSASSLLLHSLSRLARIPGRSGRNLVEDGNTSSSRNTWDEEQGLAGWDGRSGSEVSNPRGAETPGHAVGGDSSAQAPSGAQRGGRLRSGGDSDSFALSASR